MNSSPIEIVCEAPQAARAAQTRIQRTEGVEFSPNNRRLAIVDIDVGSVPHGPQVTVTSDGRDAAAFS